MIDLTASLKFIASQFTRLNRSSLSGFIALTQNKKRIGKFLPKSAIILEAGAHKGMDTAAMAKRWPDAAIHAFEPVPALFDLLTKNTQQYPNVRRYQMALSDENGASTLYVSEGTSDASSSLLPPKDHLTIHPTVAFNRKIEVETMTLDAWAESNQIPRIDFMWLDMQGMEYRVLKQSRTIFPKVQLLYTEINLKENYKGTSLYPEYRQWLIESGMKPVAEYTYWNDMGNSLFARQLETKTNTE